MQAIVVISRQAQKGLDKAPPQVHSKLSTWVATVQQFGLEATRSVPSYHDEPLQGERKGQRSIRLNKQWRALYSEDHNQQILITLLEVTPHDYRTR
jgi:proteic killer suppression protein